MKSATAVSRLETATLKRSVLHFYDILLRATHSTNNLLHTGTTNYLSNVVEWEPRQDNVCKKLCNTKDSIYHPIGQPLGIILFGGTFNGFNPKTQENILGMSLFQIPSLNPSNHCKIFSKISNTLLRVIIILWLICFCFCI